MKSQKAVRQRRGVPADHTEKSTNSSSSNGSSTAKAKTESFGILIYWKQIVGCICLIVAATVGYRGYLETRVNTPFDDKKIVTSTGLGRPSLYWGSYRPGVYFGLKTRDVHSPVVGLMWYRPTRLRPGGEGLRHWCEQGDQLPGYGWERHDAADFGVQAIRDHDGMKLRTSFVKKMGGEHGGDWTARVTVDIEPQYKKQMENEEISLIWYTALETGTTGNIYPSNAGSHLTGVRGNTPGLGDFNIKLLNHSGTIIQESFLSTVAPGLHMLKETLISSLRLADNLQKSKSKPKRLVLAGELLTANDGSQVEPNFIATMITSKMPIELDIIFESGSFGTREEMLAGNVYTEALKWHETRFDQRFEDTFHLKEKGYDTKHISFAQSTLSNMLGGIGYFYGTSRVQSIYTADPVPYWKAPLYTAVPSRSFFPRGFLWDEGFHGLLIATWDLDIELDIISHWFDLMNVEGWIPREQILGLEALAKIPEEFVTQRNTIANPPTFFLTLQHILRNYDDIITNERLATLERLYPRLQAWFSWFNTTQRGTTASSYRWRGRDATTNRELNPKTLSSGLDDYPRASHPTDDERHLDLRCWLALAADTLAKLAALLERDGYKYEQTAEYLSSNELMDKLHWSEYSQSYADYGFHTDAVILKQPKPSPRSQQSQVLDMIRVTLKNPENRLVDSSFGYISLFPFLLQILDSQSIKLLKLLTDLERPDLLWSPYGLRSLATNSPLYLKRNTEHDPPYWRGQIWLNMNYLAIRALDHYARVDGPYQQQSLELYKKLRSNVVSNVVRQYERSGYVWEQYNDRTGQGSGCKPFTGWSALTVMIMSEQY